MSVTREELHHLVDELDEDKVPGAAALLRELAARQELQSLQDVTVSTLSTEVSGIT